MDINLSRINEIIKWEDLVGIIHTELGYEIRIVQYNPNTQEIFIEEFHEGTVYVNTIVTIDEIRAVRQLSLYNLNISLTQKFGFSEVTKNKALNLINAGFEKLIMVNDIYMVDNLYPQNFLTEEELEYLYENEKQELYFSEVI